MTPRARLRLQALEAREVPSGTTLLGVSDDGSGIVSVFRRADASGSPGADVVGRGELLSSFQPFGSFRGPIRTAVGDVTGDGVEDLVVAAGLGGGPHIKVYDGAKLLTGQLVTVADFFAFDPSFRGGIYVGVGEFDNGIGSAKEIIVGAGEGGGPHVRILALDKVIFTITPGTVPPDYYFSRQVCEFFAFDGGFRGGVRVATADVSGDGLAEAIVAAGPGGGPHVRFVQITPADPFTGRAAVANRVGEFFAYDSSFRGGVYVAAGELDGDATTPEIVTGAGEGGGPLVRVWHSSPTGQVQMQAQFFAGVASNRQGVRVGIGRLTQSFQPQSIFVGPGPVLRNNGTASGNSNSISSYSFDYGTSSRGQLC